MNSAGSPMGPDGLTRDGTNFLVMEYLEAKLLPRALGKANRQSLLNLKALNSYKIIYSLY